MVKSSWTPIVTVGVTLLQKVTMIWSLDIIHISFRNKSLEIKEHSQNSLLLELTTFIHWLDNGVNQ